jgi:hypothetical protein
MSLSYILIVIRGYWYLVVMGRRQPLVPGDRGSVHMWIWHLICLYTDWMCLHLPKLKHKKWGLGIYCKNCVSSAMQYCAFGISRKCSTVLAWVQSHVKSCGVCGARTASGTCFLLVPQFQHSWLRNYATHWKIAGLRHNEAIEFFSICLVLPAELSHEVTWIPAEMNTRNKKKKKKKMGVGSRAPRSYNLMTSLPSLSQISRQCGILNISQPYRLPWPVKGIALLLLTCQVSFHSLVSAHHRHHCRRHLSFQAGTVFHIMASKPSGLILIIAN